MSKWIHMKQKKTREKKRKLVEGKEGKMTKPNEDTAYLKRDIMDKLRRSDEKMDSYSKNTDERMNDFSRKAEEMLEKFMFNQFDERITNMERKILDMEKNTNNEVKITKKNMLMRIKGKQ